MGGKKEQGAHVPYEAPNSLSSAQVLRVIDAVAEGELAGFGNGDDAPLKSVFFNDTPVQNADGSFNFKGVSAFFVRGTPDQPYIPGFAATERTVAVGAAVKRHAPVVRAVTAAQTDRLRVTVGVERNLAVQDNGDTLAANTELVVELVGANGVQAARSVLFGEKSSGAYYQDVEFDALPPVPFNLRVRRNTPDSDSDRVINNTFFASYVEITDIKLSYPHTALAALKIDSDQFGNQIPRRNYLLRGKLLQVPSNYDPETRQYAGLWDGSFKTAWTNNPAWVFYDLLTNPRYSTLARRLTAAQIDKWALYEIAKYCDAPVPDGFGGQEPRFVCNAYLTDARQAADVLADLAAAFCALPVWDGQRLSLRADTAAEPVAQYGNTNVVDGAFAYAGAALKAVHTAVHVRYADKHDGWRMKTEYLADDAAIARYGLNIKAVTAFGCDSRGQAVRFGEWLLQTELRQQDTVTFTVGREGLRHLPHDIIRIADNDYAGADIGGRVKAVSGSLMTLDRAVTASAGQILHYAAADGSLKNVRIAAQTAPDTLRVETAADVAANAVWALAGQVKPRLYRALSVRENTEDGTYTVTALRHDPAKYAAVDGSAAFERTTLHGQTPELGGGEVRGDNGALVLTWDGGGADGDVLAYDVKIYRNGSLYRHIPDAPAAEIRLENLPDGDYRADIRARNARGEWSVTLQKAWRIHYAIEGLRATGKTLAIELAWNLPETVTGKVQTELRYGTRADFQAALPLAKLPYPQNSYTLTGVAVTDTYYFWARLADADGRAGEWTAAVVGRADPNPAPIVAQIRGAVEKSSLSQALINQLKADDTAAENRAKAAASADAANKVAAEARARAEADRAEAQARAAALQQETQARTAEIRREADKQTAALRAESGRLNTAIASAAQTARSELAAQVAQLTAKDGELKQAQTALDGKTAELVRTAQQLGNRITAAESVNREQASAIQTVTAAQGRTAAAALEAEKTARANGDAAEARARETLAATVGQHAAALTAERQARIDGDAANTRELNAAKIRLGAAESGIGELRQTVANDRQAAATAVSELRASFGRAAGANLLPNASLDNWTGNPALPVAWYVYNNNRTAQAHTVTRIDGGADKSRAVRIAWQGRNGSTKGIYTVAALWEKGEYYILAVCARVPEGQPENGKIVLHYSNSPAWQNVDYLAQPTLSHNWQWTVMKARKPVQDGGTYSQMFVSVDGSYTGEAVEYCLPYASKGEMWTGYKPADAGAEIAAANAAITAEREARTAADTALTREVNTAKSRLDTAEAALQTEARTRAEADRAEAQARQVLAGKVDGHTAALADIREAKADKNQVAALARQTLSAEWQRDIDTAKTQAQQAAAQDAQAKADAARQAAERAAASDAQAKAAAAQAAAQAAASAEIRTAKEAAAADAQRKADAAKSAAEAAARQQSEAADRAVLQQAARDAQNKADHAKQAAQTAAAADAQAKANAAKVAAIADAAAKDAVLKREAAADAQTKADAVRRIAEAAQRAAQTVAADLTREQQTRAAADEANTREINAAKARLGAAESGIGELRQTTATQQRALAETQSSLNARLDNIRVGGRNYVRNSNFTETLRHWDNWGTVSERSVINAHGRRWLHLTANGAGRYRGVSQIIGHFAPNTPYTVSFDAYAASGGAVVGLHQWGNNFNPQIWRYFDLNDRPQRISFGFISADGADKVRFRLMLGGSDAGDFDICIGNVKFEQGNLATDWTPAPEDGDAATAAVSAELTAYKRSQAATDAAQTAELTAAKSQIGQQSAALEQMRTTKADKSEVSAQMQTTLQAAARDAQSKADAAKTAAERTAQTKAAEAQAAAERAAQAKADAAKQAAIAAASGDAATKANAAKAQAIADAAAKDAVIKREAAADAQSKAEAAKNAAIGEAQRLNTAAAARINELQNTVANNREAAARETRELTARIDRTAAELYARDNLLAADIWEAGNINGAGVDVDGYPHFWRIRSDAVVAINGGKHYTLTLAGGEYSLQWSWYGADGRLIRPDWVTNISTDNRQAPAEAQTLRLSIRNSMGRNYQIADAKVHLRHNHAADTAAVSAAITAEREARTAADTAQTAEITAAKSQIGSNKTAIDGIRSTKADKTEVAALARTSLASEWRSYTDTAKSQAVQTAAADAQNKAAAAQRAAEQAAERLATAKANAAQAAATAAASGDAQRKADAAKAAAVTDAAAKDAAVKREAATDAQAKADAAKTAAITEANRLNTATNARVNTLEQTVSTQHGATAGRLESLSAKLGADTNLIDTAATQAGHYISESNGNVLNWSGHVLTDFVPVSAGKTYAFTSAVPANNLRWAWYNAQRGFVSGRLVGGDSVHQTLVAPAGAAFVRISGGTNRNTAAFALRHAPIAAAVEAERTARVAADEAHTRELNTAKSRIGAAESGIGELRQTLANDRQAAATAVSELRASFGRAAGANLLPNAGFDNWTGNPALPLAWYVYNNGARTQAHTVTRIDGGADKSRAIRISWQGRNGSTKGIYTVAALWEKGEYYILAVCARVPEGQPENGKIVLHYSNSPAWQNVDYLAQPTLSHNWQWTVMKARKPVQDGGTYSQMFVSVDGSYTGEAVEYCLPYASKGEIWAGYKPADAGAEIAAANAAITAEREARTAADTALTREVNTAKSQIGTAQSQLQTLQNTIAEKDRAQVARDDLLTSAINNAYARIETAQDVVSSLHGTVRAMHTVKVQAVGSRKAVAGLALGADGETGDSQFIVMADKFALAAPNGSNVQMPFVVTTTGGQAKLALSGDMLADGLIQGKHIAAGQTIRTPTLVAARLQIGSFTMEPSGAFASRSTAANQAGLSIDNDRIVIRDTRGRVRVILGRLR